MLIAYNTAYSGTAQKSFAKRHNGTRRRYSRHCGSGLITPWTWIKDCRSTPFGEHYHDMIDTNLYNEPHRIITNYYLKCNSMFVLCSIAEGSRVRNVLWYFMNNSNYVQESLNKLLYALRQCSYKPILNIRDVRYYIWNQPQNVIWVNVTCATVCHVPRPQVLIERA